MHVKCSIYEIYITIKVFHIFQMTYMRVPYIKVNGKLIAHTLLHISTLNHSYQIL